MISITKKSIFTILTLTVLSCNPCWATYDIWTGQVVRNLQDQPPLASAPQLTPQVLDEAPEADGETPSAKHHQSPPRQLNFAIMKNPVRLQYIVQAAQTNDIETIKTILRYAPQMVNAVFTSRAGRGDKQESLLAIALHRYNWELAAVIAQYRELDVTWKNTYGDDYIQIIIHHLNHVPMPGEDHTAIIQTIKLIVASLLEKLPTSLLHIAHARLKTNDAFIQKREGPHGCIYGRYYERGYEHIVHDDQHPCIWPNYPTEITAMIDDELQKRRPPQPS